MKMKEIIPFAHQLLKENINEGETVIDATCGNGNDTLFLSNLVGHSGHIYAFDIQMEAINITKKLLTDHEYSAITYIHDSHANIDKWLPEELKQKVPGVIFNLGYLPKGNKSLITEGHSTIKAIEKSLDYLKNNGIIVIVVYHGHEGGKKEKELILPFVQNLQQNKYHVLKYEFINRANNPPFIIAIQKRL